MSNEVQQIFIGAEKKELFEVSPANVLTALTLLLRCYYVYNIEYQRGKNFLLFLQEFILGIQYDGQLKRNSKYSTFFKQLNGHILTDESD